MEGTAFSFVLSHPAMTLLFVIARIHHRPYIRNCIKSRADALANRADPATVVPQQGDVAIRKTLGHSSSRHTLLAIEEYRLMADQPKYKFPSTEPALTTEKSQ